MRLHLGCGKKRLDGYVNVDLAPGDAVDIVADVTCLPFETGSADEILAQHLIEHIHPLKWRETIASWHRILRSGGRLIIECPDLKKVCEYYASDFGGNRQWWHHCIYGDPDNGGSHLHGFTLHKLVNDLLGAGFKIEVARTWHDYTMPRVWYNLRVEAVRP